MFGNTVVYDKTKHLLLDVAEPEVGGTFVLKLEPFDNPGLQYAKRCEDYHDFSPYLMLALNHCPEIREQLNQELEQSKNPEYLGILELPSGNRVYISDGQVWDWNFEFMLVENQVTA